MRYLILALGVTCAGRAAAQGMSYGCRQDQPCRYSLLTVTGDLEIGDDVIIASGNFYCANLACTSYVMDNVGQLVLQGVSSGVRTTGVLVVGGLLDPRISLTNQSTEAACSGNTGADWWE